MVENKNSNSKNNKYSMVTVLEILYTLKRRWKIFISFVIIATFFVSILTLIFVKPQYEARTTVFVGKDENQSEGYNRSDIEMYQQLLKTYSEIIKTKDVVRSAIDLSGINKSLDKVSEDIDINIIDGTQMIEIRFRSDNPENSLKFINSLSSIFMEKAIGLIPNVSFQILDGATLPQRPVVPNMKLAIGLGILLGIIMGTMVCAIMAMLDNTIKNKEQIEEEFRIHVIGEIPKEKFVKEKAKEYIEEKFIKENAEEDIEENIVKEKAEEDNEDNIVKEKNNEDNEENVVKEEAKEDNKGVKL